MIPDPGQISVTGRWPKRAKVGLVITTYRRREYLETCLESVANSDLSGCVLCLVDESAAPPDTDPEGYTGLRGIDSPAHDHGYLHADVTGLAAAARDQDLVAFNDSGWLKTELLPPHLLSRTDPGYRLFVQDDYLDRHPEYLSVVAQRTPDRSGTPMLLDEWRAPAPTLKIVKAVHRGVHDSLRIGWDALVEHADCEYLCNLDADMVVKRHWVSALSELHRRLQGGGSHPLVCTGFNSARHQTIATAEGVCIKRTVGGANLFFDSATYSDTIRRQLLNVHWDWQLSSHMEEVGGRLAATSPSVAQHIGERGLWSRPGDFDRAADF